MVLVLTRRIHRTVVGLILQIMQLVVLLPLRMRLGSILHYVLRYLS
jgi:hypothetical protein